MHLERNLNKAEICGPGMNIGLGIVTVGFIVDGIAYNIEAPDTPTLTTREQDLKKAADIPLHHNLYVNEGDFKLRQIGFYESVILDRSGNSAFYALPISTMISG
jgi:hypothetical protein